MNSFYREYKFGIILNSIKNMNARKLYEYKNNYANIVIRLLVLMRNSKLSKERKGNSDR